VLVSQVDPAGQQAEQIGPSQATVPGGHNSRRPSVSQVPGLVAPVQRQTFGRAALVGQQVAPLFSQAPRTQVHVPAAQMPLTWHRSEGLREGIEARLIHGRLLQPGPVQ
jgi:hypothetical protein